jgi:hypothetical protein
MTVRDSNLQLNVWMEWKLLVSTSCVEIGELNEEARLGSTLYRIYLLISFSFVINLTTFSVSELYKFTW